MICVFCLQGKRGDRGSAGRDGPPVRKWWNFVWSTFNFFYCTVHFVLRDSCLTIEKEPSFFWLLIFVKSESDFEHWLCFCRVSCSNLLAPVAEFGSEFWNQSAVFFWCRFVELICKFVVLTRVYCFKLTDKKCFKVLKRCRSKFHCFVYKMLFVRALKPNLNVQSDSIRVKVFL